MTSVVGARPRARSARVEITDQGVVLRDLCRHPLVLEVDGSYVWSFTPARDGRPHRQGCLVPWPPALRPFLNGSAVVAVRDATGDSVSYEGEVVLGDGTGRISIVDRHGHPLCIDKVGHLARSFAATGSTVRDEILAGTQRALRDLRETCGVEAYLSYGALLGAVRDGSMIAHDSDTDVCYLSRHGSPADIIRESYGIQRAMRALGWRTLRMSGGDVKLLLPLSDGRACHIDVFVAFRVGGVFYQLGNRSGRLPESAVLPVSTVTLHGYDFPAPADPEAMLAFVYGPGWRVPDPSFRYADPLPGIRRLDGWLRGFRTDMGRWTEFYEGAQVRRVPRRPSDFARWVHAQLPPGEAVADLGAGTGRDAFFFARRRPVRAYDFSRGARAKLQARLRGGREPVEVRGLILNELRSVLVTGAELARDPHHLYARQLLGCLDGAARDNLWRLARMALRHGESLFLEFSARLPGQRLPEPAPAGLVRRLDPDVVRREIADAGGEVLIQELGPADGVLGGPDPMVCRMRVTWPRRLARQSEASHSEEGKDR